MNNWYEENIELPLQDLVKILRNNGINTECSCGHDMYIQCQYYPEGLFHKIHRLVWIYLSENNKALGFDGVNFDITIKHEVKDGHGHTSLNIEFPINNSSKERLEKRKKYYEEQLKLLNKDLQKLN